MYNDNLANCTNRSESCADQLTQCQSPIEANAPSNDHHDKQPTQNQCHGNNGHCIIDTKRIDVNSGVDGADVMGDVEQQSTQPLEIDAAVDLIDSIVDATSAAATTRSTTTTTTSSTSAKCTETDKIECETNLSINHSHETAVLSTPSACPTASSEPTNQSDADERSPSTQRIADTNDSHDTMDHSTDTFSTTQNDLAV